jgi:Tfp pilus assembly PilM family ATPase/Tfp pilus assembly protein PilN
MSRLLALEWNATEARMVVASARGGQCLVEQAFSVPLAPAEDDAAASESSIGRQIADALEARGIRRMETLVALGRTNIELRQLTLPPAPDEELPDMVRMQALKEFNALEEDWPLDFLPAERTADQPVKVLAAAVSPELVKQILHTCQTANIKPKRLVLRPCAAASLLHRSHSDRSTQLRLLVDLLGDEADLTVLFEGRVTYLRTVRLPGDPLCEAEAAQAFLTEIRRTMAAAQNVLGGRAVESIALCGRGPAQEALARAMCESLPVPTETFAPLAACQLAPQLRAALPERPGRFAPLLGMLLDEADRRPHAIDFLHPRKRPPPPNRRKQLLLGALAVALLLAVVFVLQAVSKSQLQLEIDTLQQESDALDRQVAKADRVKQEAGEIANWTAGEVVWLDELRQLCQDFPPAEDAMLTQLSMGGISTGHGGELKLEGLAKTAASIDALEQGLRDKAHHVEGKGRNLDNSQKIYSWRFVSSLFVDAGKR